MAKKPDLGLASLTKTFAPHDGTLDCSLQRSRKKQVYPKSRPVKKNIAVIPDAMIDDKVKSISSHRLRQLKASGLTFEEIPLVRSWSCEELIHHMRISIPYNIHFLKPVPSGAPGRPYNFLEVCTSPTVKDLLEYYKRGSWIYVLKACMLACYWPVFNFSALRHKYFIISLSTFDDSMVSWDHVKDLW